MRQLKFMGSNFWKICHSSVEEQFKYWADKRDVQLQITNSTPTAVTTSGCCLIHMLMLTIATGRSSDDVKKVEQDLDKEKQRHKRTKRELDKVKREAQKGKQTLQGLTQQISAFLSASEVERKKLERQLHEKEAVSVLWAYSANYLEVLFSSTERT